MKKTKLKYQWEENIKPLLGFVMIGAAISAGMWAANKALPSTAIVYHCIYSDSEGIQGGCVEIDAFLQLDKSEELQVQQNCTN